MTIVDATYKDLHYHITGKSGSYIYIIHLKGKPVSSEPFTSVVTANQTARKRIDLLQAIRSNHATRL